MSYAFHTADVFTDCLHGGNPLAVIPDARGLSDRQMLAITREFNYSESVFVFPPELKKPHTGIRIYTRRSRSFLSPDIRRLDARSCSHRLVRYR